jgi:hypothetical protein
MLCYVAKRKLSSFDRPIVDIRAAAGYLCCIEKCVCSVDKVTAQAFPQNVSRAPCASCHCQYCVSASLHYCRRHYPHQLRRTCFSKTPVRRPLTTPIPRRSRPRKIRSLKVEPGRVANLAESTGPTCARQPVRRSERKVDQHQVQPSTRIRPRLSTGRLAQIRKRSRRCSTTIRAVIGTAK